MLNKTEKIVAAIILTIAAAILAMHAHLYAFICDDAYISFRYAYNLATHHQLVFNPGERVEGYTNFLWTILLGLLYWSRLKMEVASQLCGTLSGIAVLLLIFYITLRYRGGRLNGWDFLAPLLLAFSSTFAVWCTSGLETMFFCALLLGGIALYLDEATSERLPSSKRLPWSGLIFALAAMTRPEGMMIFGLSVGHRFLANLIKEQRLKPHRDEIIWLVFFLVPFGAYFAWRWSYYGYPLPNTYYIKATGGSLSQRLEIWGWPYLLDFVHDNKLYGLAPLLLFFRPRTFFNWDKQSVDPTVPTSLGRPLYRPIFLWSYLALIFFTYCAYVTLVGGDFMALGRFFAPLLPLLAFFTQEGLRDFTWWFKRTAAVVKPPDFWRPIFATLVMLALLGGAAFNSYALYEANQELAYKRWGLDTVAYLKRFADDRILVGNWLRANLPADTYLAVGGAGAIVYASRLRSLDTFGLNDAWIAHHTPAVGDRPGHTKFAPESYLLQKQPDLMCHMAHHQDVPFTPSPSEQQYWRERGYQWVCLNPPGLRPAYYCCLKKLNRSLGPFPAELGS